MDDIEHAIRRRAFELWEQAGCPEGRSDEFWHAARAEIKSEGTETPVEELGPPIEEPPGIAFQARNPGRDARRAHCRAGRDRRPAGKPAEPNPAQKTGRLSAALREGWRCRAEARPVTEPAPVADEAYLPIIDLALSAVIAVDGEATVVGTSAQSMRIAFAISIACGPPVG